MPPVGPTGSMPPSPVSGTQASADTTDATTFAYLTPSSLLSYCDMRLRGLDTQIQEGVARQRQTNSDEQTLQSIASTLAKYAGGANDGASVQELQNSVGGALKQITDLNPTSPAIPALQKLQSDIQGGVTPTLFGQMDSWMNRVEGRSVFVVDGSLSSDQIQGFSTSLGDITSNLNAGAELDMINLQSLMSQRQSAVEMTTNMVQTLGDTVDKAVQNVGR